MKTIEQIESKIKIILENYNPDNPKKSDKNEYAFLKFCLNYLRTNPRESFLIYELDRLKREIEIIDLRYPEWLVNQTPTSLSKVKDIKSYYNHLNEIPEKKKQIKTIEYLLLNENIE